MSGIDRASDGLRFFRLWLQQPRQLGAILPSSRALAGAMAGCINAGRSGKVVELGAGTGSITGALLGVGVARGDLIVIERNPALCKLVAARYPGIRVACRDAQDLGAVLSQAGVSRVRTVVSSLPLLAMDKEVCDAVLQAAFAALAEDGEYLQYTYGPVQPIPRSVREALNISGRRSRWVFANLPPAAIWCFRKQPEDGRVAWQQSPAARRSRVAGRG